jgi:hypothetical protein
MSVLVGKPIQLPYTLFNIHGCNWLQLIFYFCVYDDMQRQPSTSACIQVVLQLQRQACPDKATDQARLSISGRLLTQLLCITQLTMVPK